MKKDRITKLTLAALMAALTYVATTIVKIPSPTNGFIHPGDGMVFLSGILLGPIYGAFAAGIGSMLVDLLSGYTQYVLGTFVIKALAAFTCGLLYRVLSTRFHNAILPSILSGLAASSIIVLGYFGYTYLFLGMGISAAADIPGNIIQTLFGTFTVTIIFPALKKANIFTYITH
ncbi:ECF transporter S component [Anaeromicropila populeti]|uniref:Uncharacterized membrane protein n=1 Tax=Anaeromicropila populeti TaxID=37658 RepID=A0A1I6IR79_9FIRM|nr:ECF transporter S component [Anaeromicropila populeti]SFR69216.1 Uncharacterized membrane protein [Anaeromicropila populeti]